jgi:hypothetical protein
MFFLKVVFLYFFYEELDLILQYVHTITLDVFFSHAQLPTRAKNRVSLHTRMYRYHILDIYKHCNAKIIHNTVVTHRLKEQ